MGEFASLLVASGRVASCGLKPLRIAFCGLALLVLWIVSACSGTVSGEEPPVIAYGQDVCNRCGMIIEEPRFAAAYVTPQGDVRHFDDIGDMVAHHQERGEEVHVFWVHDYTTEEWLKASEAYFVISEDLLTPMGSGILAAADQDTANRLAAEWNGESLTFDALLAQAQAGLIEGHDHHHAVPHEHGG